MAMPPPLASRPCCITFLGAGVRLSRLRTDASQRPSGMTGRHRMEIVMQDTGSAGNVPQRGRQRACETVCGLTAQPPGKPDGAYAHCHASQPHQTPPKNTLPPQLSPTTAGRVGAIQGSMTMSHARGYEGLRWWGGRDSRKSLWLWTFFRKAFLESKSWLTLQLRLTSCILALSITSTFLLGHRIIGVFAGTSAATRLFRFGRFPRSFGFLTRAFARRTCRVLRG